MAGGRQPVVFLRLTRPQGHPSSPRTGKGMVQGERCSLFRDQNFTKIIKIISQKTSFILQVYPFSEKGPIK